MAYTFQDFEEAGGSIEFALRAIDAHRSGDAYKTATIADRYD